MEGVILLILALGGLGAFGLGVILFVFYWRSGRSGGAETPIIYGNLVQCPHCHYMNPLDSAVCLKCQRPLAHQRQTYQPPPSPTYPTLPPQYQRPVPPPDAPAHYAQPSRPPGQEPTMMQDTARKPPAPHSYDPLSSPAGPQPAPQTAPQPVPNRPPGMPHAWLEGVSGVVAGQRTVLIRLDTLFGRSTQCDVQVYDPKVSRQHFRIRYGNGAFFVQDQESSRGTMINGQQVTAQRLHDGDRIELGDSALVIHIEA